MTSNIDYHNRVITSQKYFKMDDAISAPIKSKTAFIIANERIAKSDRIGRYYTVFPTFKEFLKNRNKYEHCHEIIVDHDNNKPNIAGRLVFDFDIKADNVPKKFKNQIENTIVDVVEKYLKNVDIEKFEYIWSTSQNPNKFSKHLTVKNLYFDNWIKMSKIFYQLFCVVWDEKYSWINSSKLIDFQIVRNRGSLRMVGSTKIDGYPLVFDNENHKLTDSLIRIYFKKQREQEQMVTQNNIIASVFDDIIDDSFETDSESSDQIINIDLKPKKTIDPVYDIKIYNKAYEIYNTINPKVFKMGKINGSVLSLIRLKANKCLISGRFHEQENAFLVILKKEDNYSIRFGCYRFCHKIRTIYIGSISIDNLEIMINPNFEPPTKYKIRKIIDV